MHSNTIKIVLILLQTKHATNSLYPHFKYGAEKMCPFKSREHKEFSGKEMVRANFPLCLRLKAQFLINVG